MEHLRLIFLIKYFKMQINNKICIYDCCHLGRESRNYLKLINGKVKW